MDALGARILCRHPLNKPGVADFTVSILTASGQPIEELTIKGAFLDFSSGGRMRGALKRTAGILSVYMNDKWACVNPAGANR